MTGGYWYTYIAVRVLGYRLAGHAGPAGGRFLFRLFFLYLSARLQVTGPVFLLARIVTVTRVPAAVEYRLLAAHGTLNIYTIQFVSVM